MNNWTRFYSSRVRTGYQDYFEERYHPFLMEVIRTASYNSPYKGIVELGCGIGSVSKALRKVGMPCKGFDLDEGMVVLANYNVGEDIFTEGCIFSSNIDKKLLGVSHGVLEHFSDKQILSICSRYKGSVHYVPLDKYKTPSFGDERLLPYKHWINLVKPQSWFLFNDGYDLCFKV